MKKRLAWLLVLCLTCGFNLRTDAQAVVGGDQFDYSPKTPEVASMQKLVDVPVSYFSGSANISIPLHVAHSKSIDIPLTLAYETSGIKAAQKATSVGLGWVLKYGGMITRNVKGNPDEGLIINRWRDTLSGGVIRFATPLDSLSSLNGGKSGGYYTDGGRTLDIATISAGVKTHNQLVNTGATITTNAAEEWLYNGLNDDGPDMFYFNFGDYSGKFFFGTGRVPIMVPYNKDLKIVPVMYNSPISQKLSVSYFDSWMITTPEGITYYFGETADAKGYARYYTANNWMERPQSWSLTKIVNNNTKDSVVLGYQRTTGTDTSFARQKYITLGTYNVCNSNGSGVTSSSATYTSVASDPLLTSIQTRTEKIDCYYSGELDSIIVRDVNSLVPYKKIQLTYGTFSSGRLKLQEALIMNYQHTQVLPYTFNYYDTSFQKIYRSATHDSVPFFSMAAQDFWGYYNDEINIIKSNSLFVNTVSDPATGICYPVTRKPAFPQMERDILTEVIYPTGGKTRFVYEPHSVSTGRMPNGTLGDFDTYTVDDHHNFHLGDMVGGLRVKRIEQIDPVRNDTLIKTFNYTATGSSASSGSLHISPSMVAQVIGFSCNGDQTNSVKYIMSTQNMQSGSGDGLHVTYKNVTVAQERNNIKNGYTRYDFFDDTNTDSSFYFNVCDNINNSCAQGDLNVLQSWQEKKPYMNLLAGTLMSTSIFNSADQLQSQERDQYYSIKYTGINRIVEFNSVKSTDVCDHAVAGSSDLSSLPANRHLFRSADSYMFVQSYVIGKMSVLLQQKIKDSYDLAGNKRSDTIQYYYNSPNHISSTSTKATASNSDSLTTQTIYSLDLKDVNGTDSLGLQMRNAGFNVPVAQFSGRSGKIINGGYSLYRRTSPTDAKSILQREQYKLITAAPLDPATINLTTVYPKVLNFPAANFQRVNTLSYDSDNNVVQLVQKDQNNNGFVWGYNNSRLVAKVGNAGSGEIAYTSFESGNNGNWLVPSALRNNTALTGVKSYALANGNVTLTIAATGKKMIVSYWSTGAAAQVNGVAATSGPTQNGWTYYQHLLPETTTTITVSGTGVIDELRLYPTSAQMTTYSYDPMLGVTSVTTPENRTAYYEYDTLQELTVVRDADRNIVKAADYQQAGFNNTLAAWRPVGQTRCKPCAANAAYITSTLQALNVDMNKSSATWNTQLWMNVVDTVVCKDISAWTNTATATRCLLDGNNQNTGYQQQEQIDLNPCSPTYNTTRWLTISFNTVCKTCTGTDKRTVLGNCETGHKVYTSSLAIMGPNSTFTYKCTYHLEWSDCFKGPDVIQTGLPSPCTLNLSCTDN